jgi:phospholipid/cholesterol/gamma-HCH transport system substrate-binding protein
MLVTILATGVLVVLIGNITFSHKTEYKAEFVDATGSPRATTSGSPA